MINGATNLVCLLGSPVKHTFSPTMHNAAFGKLNINSKYMAFDIKKSDIENVLNGLKAMNFIGANVTIPHKMNVMPFLDVIDEKAKLIGAVNTIVLKDGLLYGYNTDVIGFVQSFKNRDIELKGKSVAVLGTGGAAKAIVVGMLFEGVAEIDIFSREIIKSKIFVDDISYKEKPLFARSYDKFDNKKPYDIIINTSPIGMHPYEGESILQVNQVGHKNTIFYDLIYNPLETEFLKQARESQRLAINGLDMLIYQGIEALKIWYPNITIEQDWTKEDVMEVLKSMNVI